MAMMYAQISHVLSLNDVCDALQNHHIYLRPYPRLLRQISSNALLTHVFNEHTLVLVTVDEPHS